MKSVAFFATLCSVLALASAIPQAPASETTSGATDAVTTLATGGANTTDTSTASVPLVTGAPVIPGASGTANGTASGTGTGVLATGNSTSHTSTGTIKATGTGTGTGTTVSSPSNSSGASANTAVGGVVAAMVGAVAVAMI